MEEPKTFEMTQVRFRRLAIPFFLMVMALAATTFFDYRAVDTLVKNQRTRVTQRLVAVELQNLMGLARMAETGQRGFVITGQEEYLAPFHYAKKNIPASISFLKQNIQSDPEQIRRLNVFENLVEKKFQELELSIQARRTSGFAAAQEIVLTNRGKQFMDEMSRLIQQLDTIERAKLDSLIQRSERSADQAFTTIAIAGLIDVILLLSLFILVRKDIRTRDAAAQQLAEAQTMLRNVVDGSPAVIYLKDLSGRFMLINKAYEEISGVKYENIGGKTPDEIFPESIAKLEKATDHSVLDQGALLQYEEKIPTAEGDKYFVTSKLPLRNHLGVITGVCAVSTDVTSLKVAENEVRMLNQTLERRVSQRTEELATANARLEDANGELEAFSYTVAHDLRAPLRSMQGFADAVGEDYEDILDNTGRDYLSRIAKAAIRMEGLIEDLLNFSRLSRMDVRLEEVRLDDVIDEARANLAAQILLSNAELKVASSLHVVYANRGLCVQIFQNLLSNAIKFSQRGERADIRLWSEIVQAENLPDTGLQSHCAYVRVWVADDGIGIAPEKVVRIFRPFERLHGVDEYPGSGIGLAIVDKAVKRMNGACGVESTPGKGSQFWIALPKGESA